MLHRLLCLLVLLTACGWSQGYRRPVDLKLLILATDGEEAGLAALREYLDYAGTPYDILKLASGDKLPDLHDGRRGFYQGIILTLGNLGYCKPDCRSALNQGEWERLDAYTRDYGVRTLSYYTFPEARYGMTYVKGVSTTQQSPLAATLTPQAEAVFTDLRPGISLPVMHAYAYLAAPVSADGERTTPLLRVGNEVVAVLHQKDNGRESIALTFDNNPNLQHSLMLQRGLINWVTRGVHLGWRKAWIMPQVDDLFLPNYLFDASIPVCATSGGHEIASGQDNPCPKLRIDAGDLEAVNAWQVRWHEKPQFAGVRVSMAFNAFGVKSDDDPLLISAQAHRDHFLWVSHTFSHKHMDCYAPTATGCRPINEAETRDEIESNRAAARRFGLPLDDESLVTPQISGLHVPAMIRTAAGAGIVYFVSDTSKPDFLPARANTIVPSPLDARVRMIPRRPTAIFYNASDALPDHPGSEPDEYNFLFGPNGKFRRADGSPFFSQTQTYEQLIDHDGDLAVGYLLRGEMYPLMFHQANLWRYRESRTLLTDFMEDVLTKFEALSVLPVASPSQTAIGHLLSERHQYWRAGVTATLYPGSHVTVTTRGDAVVPLTGACVEGTCNTYGPYQFSSTPLTGGSSRNIPLAAVR